MAFKSTARKIIFSHASAKSMFLYRLCKRYVDLCNGENNDDIETNGELRLMRCVLPKCDTVFDVGANAGQWAELALAINPRINLHCFEPSIATYRKLLARNFPYNVACNNLGLSSATGEARIFVFEEGSGNNSLYRRTGLEDGWGMTPQQRQEIVHLETVDRYCQSRDLGTIDFCKIDVEGHELEVLKGMSGMLESGRVNIIQFEYGGCNIDAGVLLRDIFGFFKRFEYRLHKVYPRELRPMVRYDQRLENFQYQNWIAIANKCSFQV